MVKKVDAFIVPVAWAPETNAIIDERIFRNMQQNSFIVNVARGECIEALLRKSGESKITL